MTRGVVVPPRRPGLTGRGIRRLLGATWTALAVAGPVAGQVPAEPRLEGVVERGTTGPVPDATVLLHRIDAVEAGEIDSVRTDPSGGFSFRLPTVPDPGGRDEIYFASVRHQGIVYFGPAISQAVQLDSVYRIQVFDTTVAPAAGAPIPLGVRYLLAEPMDSGWRVTDLMQLDVIGERTWVSAPGGVTWRYPMPEGTSEAQVGGGDLPAEGTRVGDGVIEVSSAISPGTRQLVSRYRLDSLDLTVPVPGGAREMEFLVQEPAPELVVAGLAATETVEMDGVSYRRYAGTELGSAVVRIQEGAAAGFALSLPWLAVLLGLGLTAVGIYVVQRGGSGAGAPDPVPAAEGQADRRNRILVEIARVDEALESAEGPEVGALRDRRGTLMARLRDLG